MGRWTDRIIYLCGEGNIKLCTASNVLFVCMFVSLPCRAARNCCPSLLSARLMEHGINPCPAAKVSELGTGVVPLAVGCSPKYMGGFSLSNTICLQTETHSDWKNL